MGIGTPLPDSSNTRFFMNYPKDFINKIICGNTLEVLKALPSESVNCVVTSPPYWGLRDYGIEPVIWDGDKDCKHEWGIAPCPSTKLGTGGHDDPKWETLNRGKCESGNFCQKCGAWRGSLGLEPTFELYIKHLCDIFDEIKRVLRKDGTCWVNLGDTYIGGGGGNYGNGISVSGSKTKHLTNISNRPEHLKRNNLQAKSLCLIPQRFAIEMVNRGWILRNTIIWHKPNCMPSSAKDRFTVDFEYVYFFTKSSKTQFWTNSKTGECVSKKPLGTKGIEGIDWEWRKRDIWNEINVTSKSSEMEGYLGYSERMHGKKSKITKKKKVSLWTGHDYWFEQQFDAWTDINPYDTKRAGKYIQYGGKHKGSKDNKGVVVGDPVKGRNKRAVWKIPTKPFPEAHFAVYPEKLIEPMIKAGCPRYVCKKCGKARVKIINRDVDALRVNRDKRDGDNDRAIGGVYQKFMEENPIKFKGYTDCGCNAGFEGGIVLDPFMGAGTTAVVAKKLGRQYLGIEIKQEYIDMANKRIKKIPELLF